MNKHRNTISQLCVLLLLAVSLSASVIGCGSMKKMSLNGAAFSDILVAELTESTESIAEPSPRSNGKPGLRDTGAALILVDLLVARAYGIASVSSEFFQYPIMQYGRGAKPVRGPPFYTI